MTISQLNLLSKHAILNILDENTIDDNDLTFLHMTNQYQRMAIMTGVYVDFYGTFIEALDPASLPLSSTWRNSVMILRLITQI